MKTKTNEREYRLEINGEKLAVKISVEKSDVYKMRPNRLQVSLFKCKKSNTSDTDILDFIDFRRFYLSNRSISNPKKVSSRVDRAIEKMAWEFFTIITIPDYCGKYNLTEIEVGEDV